MTFGTSNLSKKQILLIGVGVVVLVVILIIVVNMYGSFVKTQVAPSTRDFTENTALKTDALEPGMYTLKLRAENDSNASSQTSTTFEIVEGTVSPY